MNRSLERLIKFVLDECIPPLIRDSRLFVRIPFLVAFGKKGKYFLTFKDKVAFRHDDAFFAEIYRKTSSSSIQSEDTDLSPKAMKLILEEVQGTSILDVGCGRGKLASILSNNRKVTGCDIVIDESTVKEYPGITFHETDICSLPFADNQFDTVTCTHTLEHIWDIESAVRELRRVTAQRLIVVVPKERAYRYAFNLHLHFFTFRYQVARLFRKDEEINQHLLEDLGTCWYYREDCT